MIISYYQRSDIIKITLDNLPGFIVTHLCTGPLLEEVEFCSADDAVAVEVNAVEDLCQGLSELRRGREK